MTKNEQLGNIIAFLSIVFGDEDPRVFDRIVELHPDYIIEKFNRYIESTRVEFPWGMHPALRDHAFYKYMRRWQIELDVNDYGL